MIAKLFHGQDNAKRDNNQDTRKHDNGISLHWIYANKASLLYDNVKF